MDSKSKRSEAIGNLKQKNIDRKNAIKNIKKKGGPRFIGGEPATFGGVIKDTKDTSNKLSDIAVSINSNISDKVVKAGNAISKAIHNKSFPTKQDKIYNKKIANDEWENSDVRKQLLELEVKK